MVKTLLVKCPHCNQVSEIFLSTNACVIILNCPTCFSPIMYFERKIFLLSKKQVEAIKDTTRNASVLKMLDRIAHPEHTIRNTAKKLTQVHKTGSTSGSEFLLDLSSRPDREKYICNDDITNLRIELALCSDTQQFIEHL